jgi:two-component system, OmpR family, KDP operon response regulator KdpE
MVAGLDDHRYYRSMRDEHDPAPRLAGPRRVSALVIDDDPDARELLSAIATKVGYTIATAQNGRDGLALLHTICPDVIFVDLRMPIMSGAEFREAQRRNRAWLSIPTIVMTGTSDEPLLDLAIEQTLRKPVRASELLAIIARYAGDR